MTPILLAFMLCYPLQSEELPQQIVLVIDGPITSEAEALLQLEHSLETGDRPSRRFERLIATDLRHVLLHS